MIIARLKNGKKYHIINPKEGGVSSYISHCGKIFVESKGDALNKNTPSAEIFDLHIKGEMCERCMNIRLLN